MFLIKILFSAEPMHFAETLIGEPATVSHLRVIKILFSGGRGAKNDRVLLIHTKEHRRWAGETNKKKNTTWWD